MNTVRQNKGGSGPRMIGAAALMLALVPVPVVAQSVSDYRLPGAQTPRPDVEGPVDPDNPVVRGPAPRPSTVPLPTPTATAASPSPQPGASPSVSPAPSPGARAAQPRPLPTAVRPAATPTANPAPAATFPAQLPTAGASPNPIPTSAPDIPPLPAASPDGTASKFPWPLIAGAAALLFAALGGLLWRRRRRTTLDLELDFEPAIVAQPKPAPTPDPVPQPIPLAAPAIRSSGLTMALEVRRMNASLMATTLSYNLKLTNHSAEPLSALAIEGDMVAAHASLPPERQIASRTQRLELRHALVELAPGGSAVFTGEFRLPLTAITPIRSGAAAFFVPLARIRVEASTPSGSPLIAAQTFVVGELPEAPGAALRPFRLDLGPRNYARVGQRSVS